MKWRKHIKSNPEILFGKPVVSGTRIAVELILEKINKGETEKELLRAFPHINSEQIKACFYFSTLYRNIFIQARKFQKASYLMNRNIIEDNGALIIPYVVNLSFTLELYLKCLIHIEKLKVEFNHSLLDLFNEISKPVRSSLISKYNREIESSFTVHNLSSISENSVDLLNILKESEKAFVTFRYSFENEAKGFLVASLAIFVELLIDQIIELKPELKSIIN